MTSTAHNLSERDLLIELKTELKSFKEYVREKFEGIERSTTKIDNLETELIELKGEVKENSCLRKKVNNIIYGLVAELILIIGVLISVITKIKI